VTDALHAVDLRQDDDGPVYLGLHGWVGGFDTFERLAEALPEGRFLSVDLPGYGDSAPPSAWTSEQVVERLEAFVEARDLERFVLVGNCSGAAIAMLALPRLRGRLEGVVLVEPFGFVPWYFALFTWPLLGAFFYFAAFRNPVGRAIVSYFTGEQTGATSLEDDYARVSPQTTLGLLRSLSRSRLSADHFQGSSRVLLVSGSETFPAVRQTVGDWSARFEGARAEELQGAGHLLLQDRAEEVATILSDWVRTDD
jgi:pimeloyl-ACP methyl ester carboxylesterase